jgi:hypothetical protein
LIGRLAYNGVVKRDTGKKEQGEKDGSLSPGRSTPIHVKRFIKRQLSGTA